MWKNSLFILLTSWKKMCRVSVQSQLRIQKSSFKWRLDDKSASPSSDVSWPDYNSHEDVLPVLETTPGNVWTKVSEFEHKGVDVGLEATGMCCAYVSSGYFIRAIRRQVCFYWLHLGSLCSRPLISHSYTSSASKPLVWTNRALTASERFHTEPKVFIDLLHM